MDKKVQDILSKMTLEDKISLCNGADFGHSKAMAQYGIPEDKISVVHNAVSRNDIHKSVVIPERCRHEKRVLFMGRVTYQKGPG